MNRITRMDLIHRMIEMSDTWFLDEAAPPSGARMYRLLEKQRGKPMSEWTTGLGMKMFLDGYERAMNDVEENERVSE